MPINNRNVFMDSVKRRMLKRPPQNTQPVKPKQSPDVEPVGRGYTGIRKAIGRAPTTQPIRTPQVGEAGTARDSAAKMQEALSKRNEWDIIDKSASQLFQNNQPTQQDIREIELKKAGIDAENIGNQERSYKEQKNALDEQKRKSTQPVKPTTSAAKSATKSSAMRKRTAII